MAEMKAQLDLEPAVKRIPSGRLNPARDALEGKIAELQAQREALLAEYRPHTPQITALDAQIARLKPALSSLPLEQVVALTSPNPARDEVDRVLALPVLGHVPAIPAHQSVLMAALPAGSPIAESYRALRSAISFAAVDHPLRTLLVSSAGKGEGKTLTSMNLAIAL